MVRASEIPDPLYKQLPRILSLPKKERAAAIEASGCETRWGNWVYELTTDSLELHRGSERGYYSLDRATATDPIALLRFIDHVASHRDTDVGGLIHGTRWVFNLNAIAYGTPLAATAAKKVGSKKPRPAG